MLLMNVSDNNFWCVVHSHVNSENKAQINLIQQGFEVFLPQYERVISHARKKTLAMRPVYPRYLFVSVKGNNNNWRAICSTRGVSSLVMSGNTPTKVPDDIIFALKDRINSEGVLEFHTSNLKEGDNVNINNGVFTDRLGLISDLKDENRVVILLKLLERQVRVSINPKEVMKV